MEPKFKVSSSKTIILIDFASRAFVTWNEKFVHVWNPNTRQLLYSVDVYQETKSHVNSTLCYSVKNFVSLS